MCGIAGIFHLDGAIADNAFGQRMSDSLSHRGPDGEGLWADGPRCGWSCGTISRRAPDSQRHRETVGLSTEGSECCPPGRAR
jgi:asparagine synthetase B (glutamine-hydrolysing)